MKRFNQYLPYLIIAILIAGGWRLVDHFLPPDAPVNQYQTAPVAPQVAHVKTITIQPAQVKVYAPEAKQKLNLPADVQSNPSIYALSATRIKPDLRPQTIVTTLDASTGEAITYARRDPLPWLAAQQTGELRLDYGYKGISPVMRLSAREELLQVKALRLGVIGTIDSDGQFFIGAGAAVRW